MIVERQVGRARLAIDTKESCRISLIEEGEGDAAVSLTRKAFLRQLAEEGRFIPLLCQWEILDRCNLACPFCYIVGHSNRKLVRFPEIETHLQDLVDAGLLFCTLTGGDPLIHPDFRTIYRHLKERGVIVTVFTNAVALDDETMDLFCELPPKEVEVSIYTMDESKFRATYNAPRAAAGKVLEGLLKMKVRGVAVTAKTFANKVTAPDLAQIETWCKEHEIRHYSSSEITQAYDGADLSEFRIEPLYRIGRSGGSTAPGSTRAALPCDTHSYGGAIDAAFRFSACPAIRHEEAFFDMRKLGVTEALRQTHSLMARIREMEIHPLRKGEAVMAACVAKAQAITGGNGKIIQLAG